MAEQTPSDRYLGRLGLASTGDTRTVGPTTPADVVALADRHLHVIPFENLTLHEDPDRPLDQAAVLAQLGAEHRGGICYDLNAGFAVLLRHRGVDAEPLSARVHRPDHAAPDGTTLGPPLGHLALRVQLDRPWLVDVGFGGRALVTPLPRAAEDHDTADEHPTDEPAATAAVATAATFRPVGEHELDVSVGGDRWYRLDLRARTLADFAPMRRWQATAPDSRFARSLVASVATATGRTTVTGDRLQITDGAAASSRDLLDSEEVLAACRALLDLDLERLPTPARADRGHHAQGVGNGRPT